MNPLRFLPLASLSALAFGFAPAAASVAPIQAGVTGGVHDFGPATAAVRVNVALVLNYHHETELDQLIDAQSNPRTPMYHHFLSPAEFNRYFAPTDQDYGRVVLALRRAGFTITHEFQNRTVVDASAPAPVAARFFRTDIHRVFAPGLGLRYTNVRPGVVPPELGDVVFSVLGLDSVRRLHPDIAYLPPGTPRTNRISGPDATHYIGPDGGYGPAVFINSYDLPIANGFDGTGHSSGIATDGDYLDNDLSAYLSYFGVSQTGSDTRIPVDGGPPKGLSQDSIETELDLETISSLAPGSNVRIYEGPFSSTLSNFIDIYNAAVNDDIVDTMNSSYSECETAFLPDFPRSANEVEKQGSALGITFHSATGDDGTDTYGCSSAVSVGTPADTPYNIAVGGTRMTANHTTGEEVSEVGWHDQSGATGGGVSVIFKHLKFQKHVKNVIKTGRNIPDLAFDASPYTGESLYYNGRWSGPIGGTSLASPIFGASLTEINDMLGARSGWFNPTLYATWEANGYGASSLPYFRDITTGAIAPYSAMPGYDQMSGIGAMLVSNFGGLL